MSGSLIGGLFTRGDYVKMGALNQRLERQHVINSNVANAETPGYRALGYDFEEQLQALSGSEDNLPMKASNPKHYVNGMADADGNITPEVYLRPTESIGQDGNTVDVDQEMAAMAENQLLYRATAELITKKIGTLKYAISNGGQG